VLRYRVVVAAAQGRAGAASSTMRLRVT
jgi:hypothetical protein